MKDFKLSGQSRNFLECGRDSYRFSSGTRSLPVLAERRNEFRLRKAEAVASAFHMRIFIKQGKQPSNQPGGNVLLDGKRIATGKPSPGRSIVSGCVCGEMRI
jgi:hypothetical protein